MENLPQNVDRLILDSRTIYLVGTAHISQQSVDLVQQVIESVNPDTVAIELCEQRYQAMSDPERWKNTDIFEVIRKGRVHLLTAQLVLSTFQRRLAGKLNIKPGAEMMRAAQLANERGSQLVFADRVISITLKRTWAALDLLSSAKMIAGLFDVIFGRTSVTEEEIERLKSSDALNTAMHEFSQTFPKIKHPLIDERDQYLAGKLQQAPGQIIVAVVGAGHVPGMKYWIEHEIDLAKLNSIPAPSIGKRLAAWILPGIVIGALVYGFISAGPEKLQELLSLWVIITGVTAAIGAALALAHPLTILAAFISAPITTLHPLLGSGMVAGLVEAYLRKPRVSDLESVSEDLMNWKGFWRNRVCRILLVVMLTSLVGALGMLIGVGKVASMVVK